MQMTGEYAVGDGMAGWRGMADIMWVMNWCAVSAGVAAVFGRHL